MVELAAAQVKFWVALNQVSHLGTARFQRLENYFGNLSEAWHAAPAALRAAGLDERAAQALTAARSRIDPEAEMARLDKAGLRVLTWHDSEYPARLRALDGRPPLLYIQGQLLPADDRAVAVVGTRRPTAYGREAAAQLSGELAAGGIVIISGLALGVDAIAHRAALSNGGRTLAVVANGLDIAYPPANADLYRRIAEQGAVVSEYPLGVRPDPRHFPRRNRLISGLSLGTLVVEAGENSGARWTVYHALDQGREVFCVPGSIFSPASRLTNRLIQEGAKLAAGAADILAELNLSAAVRQTAMELPAAATAELPAAGPADLPAAGPAELPAAAVAPAGPELDGEAELLRRIQYEPVHIDELQREAGMSAAAVSSLLTLLELKGQVKQVGGMNYIRTGETRATYGR